MLVMRHTAETGWTEGVVRARAPLQIDPACAVLHYAQEIFEGMKAYRTPDGGAALFRPDANARRFAASAERMAMPVLPDELFRAAVATLVEVERDWIPEFGQGSLYPRPFMFASEAFLGVRPSAEYLFVETPPSFRCRIVSVSGEVMPICISRRPSSSIPLRSQARSPAPRDPCVRSGQRRGRRGQHRK